MIIEWRHIAQRIRVIVHVIDNNNYHYYNYHCYCYCYCCCCYNHHYYCYYHYYYYYYYRYHCYCHFIVIIIIIIIVIILLLLFLSLSLSLLSYHFHYLGTKFNETLIKITMAFIQNDIVKNVSANCRQFHLCRYELVQGRHNPQISLDGWSYLRVQYVQRLAHKEIDGALLNKWTARMQTRLVSRWPLNPLRANFFRGNINIYLHFLSFLHTDKTQVVEIPLWVRQWPAYST